MAVKRPKAQSPGRQQSPSAPPQPTGSSRQLPWILATAVLGALPLVGVVRHQFLNWDDTIAITQNPHLLASGTIPWAFTTSLLDHYQPVTWLIWSATARVAGIMPAAFHAISLLGHLLNIALVYVLALQLAPASPSSRVRSTAAAIAALVFALHPVQVETVAWASAFPYVVAVFFLLLSTVVYVAYVRSEKRRVRGSLLAVSCLLYVVSLLCREYALLFPVVLLCLDFWVLRRSAPPSQVLIEKVPFVVAALVGGWFESTARVLPTLADLTAGQRLELAIATPFLYIGRLLLPVSLSPVYPLPVPASVGVMELAWLVAAALGLAAMLVYFRRFRAVVCAVAVFLLFIAPTLMAPSGVQASADRYLYVALVPFALGLGALVAQSTGDSVALQEVAGVLIVACAALTVRQVSFWRDSVTLWSRAVALDQRNDIATYNLASALGDAGRVAEAATWYERTIALVPDHAQAKMNLAAIQSARYEADGSRLASQGQFAGAIAAYDRVLEVDPDRPHARAARGIALTRVGRWDAAVADLMSANQSGIKDPEVANSLAFALAHLGRDREAVAVLKDALHASPDDVSIAHNLAQLLLDSSDAAAHDAQLAQKLALEVCARTGNRDPRALETLAMAYASNGDRQSARETAALGLIVARSSGDTQTATALEQMIRQLGS